MIKIINKKKTKAKSQDKDNEIILDTLSECCFFFNKLTCFAINYCAGNQESGVGEKW
jgi:hypothetical protein